MIRISQGYRVLVDSDDYDWLIKYPWKALKAKSGQVYALNHSLGLMHRAILGVTDNRLVDHENRNGLDNRKRNLRFCDRVENVHNSEAAKGTSKLRGVSYHACRDRWIAQIVFEKQHYFIGRYKSEREAKAAYDAKRAELLGEHTQSFRG